MKYVAMLSLAILLNASLYSTATATIISSSTFNEADATYTYSYLISHDLLGAEQLSITQWIIPFFDRPEDVIISGSISAPDYWAYEIVNPISAKWSYNPALDSNAGSYGVSDTNLTTPDFGLYFSIDQTALNNAQTGLEQAISAQNVALQNYNTALNTANQLVTGIQVEQINMGSLVQQIYAVSENRDTVRDEIIQIRDLIEGTTDPAEIEALSAQLESLQQELATLGEQAQRLQVSLEEQQEDIRLLNEQLELAEDTLAEFVFSLAQADAYVARAQQLLDSVSGISFTDDSLLFSFSSLLGPIDAPAQVEYVNGESQRLIEPVVIPFRLSGDVTSVPEPTSLTLMGLGLVGLSFARRKNVD